MATKSKKTKNKKPAEKKVAGKPAATAKLPTFQQSKRTIYDVPLNLIRANPGNPSDSRDREVIPTLFAQGYRIFPATNIKDDHVLWTMLNGQPGEAPDAALREQAVMLLREFDPQVADMATTIETQLVHPIHIIVRKGVVGIESGMVRALAKSFLDAAHNREAGTIEAEVENDPDQKLMLARATIENIHVIANQPIALARRYQFMKELGMSVDEIAKRVGWSDQTVRNYLDIASLPLPAQEAIAAKQMTMQEGLELCRESRETNRPLDDVVSDLFNVADDGEEGESSGGMGGRRRGRAARKGKKSCLKWDKAFLVYVASAGDINKSELTKLTKEQLIERVVAEHEASLESLRQILQIDEAEAERLMSEHLAADIDLADEDFGFGELFEEE